MFIEGQRVACIDDQFPTWALALYTELPVKGKIYTIRGIGIGLDVKAIVKDSKVPASFVGEEDLTVWLQEIVNPDHPVSKEEYGFKASRFAPLEELTEEAIEKMVVELEQGQEIENPIMPERELVEIK